MGILGVLVASSVPRLSFFAVGSGITVSVFYRCDMVYVVVFVGCYCFGIAYVVVVANNYFDVGYVARMSDYLGSVCVVMSVDYMRCLLEPFRKVPNDLS